MISPAKFAQKFALTARVAASLFVCGLCPPAHGAEGIMTLTLRDPSHGATNVSVGQSRATVVLFVSMDCPMSMDYGQRIGQMEKEFSTRDVQVILVDSNRNETDSDVEKARKALNIITRIYRDPGAAVAGRLNAIATPTAIVLDSAGAIRYKGSIDDSRDPVRVKRHYVQAAVEAVLSGRAVQVPHTRVLGCSIKR